MNRTSDIRKAVLAVTENGKWEGRCSDLIYDALEYNIPLEETPKTIGGFLKKHAARFHNRDGIKIEIINKGTASKYYRLEKIPFPTISTISEDEELPFWPPEKASVYAAYDDYEL